MAGDSDSKSIDFDQVADLYDSYVQVDFDIEFWKQEAPATNDKVLELMCGTGRIGMPLIEAGASCTGMDYCQKQIAQFQSKVASQDQEARLVFDDARSFDLNESFDLIFIGFSSLAEVVDNEDKIAALRRVHTHLKPTGCFTFSLHNPAVRNLTLDYDHSFDLLDGSGTLDFTARFQQPSSSGIVTGIQQYEVKDHQGATTEVRELDLTFHLIPKGEIEGLLATTGFRVEAIWGEYDRSPFVEVSPFMIFQCRPQVDR